MDSFHGREKGNTTKRSQHQPTTQSNSPQNKLSSSSYGVVHAALLCLGMDRGPGPHHRGEFSFSVSWDWVDRKLHVTVIGQIES
eukprot:750385-Rhodomonas_salina.3